MPAELRKRHARAVDADPPVTLANRVADDGVQVIGPVAVDPAGDRQNEATAVDWRVMSIASV